MNLSDNWERVEEVFHAALSQEPGRRDEFLSQACAADVDLLAEVRSLISAHEQSGSFIDTPAYELMADRLVESGAQNYVGRTLGHYAVLTHLGRGGMGDVYLARDSRLDRKVALKVLTAQGCDGDSEQPRFLSEAKAASSLNHPNIITIYDAGQEDGSHYIATELIDGHTLRHKMQESRFELSEALQIAIQVAGALAEAHAAGIVHRDIKPENIMIRRDGLVKVLDFGLATSRDIARAAIAPPGEPLSGRGSTTETTPGTIMGTINYMSPEQARGEAVDGQSDVFSLGVVIYEMTTGRRPFKGETDGEAVQSIKQFDPFPAPGMDRELEPVLRRALAKDKRLRYQTTDAFLLDLKKLAERLARRSDSAGARHGTSRWIFQPSAKGMASLFLLVTAALIIFRLSHGTATPVAQPLPNAKIIATWKNGIGPPDYGASFSPDGSTVAFSSTKAGHPNIWTKELSVRDPVQITQTSSENVSDLFPIWSPDGREIAFASDRSNAVGIWSLNAGGGQPVLVARLPDGAEPLRLVYWSKNAGIYYERHRNLFCLDIASGHTTQITGFDPLNSHAGYFSISPEEDRVLYSYAGEGRDGIWAFKMDDPQHPVRVAEIGRAHIAPVWLAGNRIAFSAEVSGIYQIFVGSADGARPQQITSGDASNFVLAASAAGDKLLFSSLGEESDLWKATVATDEETQVTWESTVELLPSTSPDGGRLLFQILDDTAGGRQLLHSRLACKPLTGVGRQITLALDAFDAKWSPAGNKIAFIRDVGGRSDIWTVDPDGSNERQITANGVTVAGFSYKPYNRGQSYDWSPDGSRIAYGAQIADVTNVYTTSADGSDERNISGNSNSALAFSSIRWSPDGKSLAFISTDTTDKMGKRLFAIWVSNGGPANGGPPEIVYQSSAPPELVGCSQNGAELIVGFGPEEGSFHLVEPSMSLARLSPTTKSIRIIARVESAYPLSIRLSPNGASIAFVSRSDGADNIWIIPAWGGRIRSVTQNSDPRLFISGLEWSPDSQALFYGKQTDRSVLSQIDRF